MEEKKSSRTAIIAESAVLVAMACVLSLFPKFKFLPYGGSITICSMLPIVLVSYRRGLKWGFMAAFVFAVFQTLTGFTSVGFSFWSVVGVLAFDYILAFTVLGIGGIFRGKGRSVRGELVCGCALALCLRTVMHIIGGYILWGEYAEWFFGEAGDFGAAVLERFSGNGLALIYSVCYNLTYMVPELIITCIAAALLAPIALYPEKSGRVKAAE